MENLKIMIVEDDDFQREILKKSLESIFIKNIAEAVDPVEALMKFSDENEPFDIVITDLHMPKMDGVEFIENLSKYKYANSVIILSGLDPSVLKSTNQILNCMNIRCMGVFSKPVDVKILKEAILRYNDTNLNQRKISFNSKIYSTDEIKEAIIDDEIEPFFQPKVNISTMKIEGLEALARWIHKKDGIIPPFKFIPVIESDRELNKIFTFKIIEKSLLYLKNFKNIDLAVNISAELLEDPDFLIELIDLLEEKEIKYSNIVIELTETAIAKNKIKLLSNLTKLRIKGLKLSIDDFGTGYSSLAQLTELPFTELKIDIIFVKELNKEKKKLHIVKMASALAKNFNLKTVAEGAEKEEEIKLLRELGIDCVQSYYFARPMPFDETVKYLEKYKNGFFK